MTLFQKNFFLSFTAVILLLISTLFSQENPGQSRAITISEYTKFLNYVGATDTYGIYNVKMGADEGMGPLIIRFGSPGSYTYSYNAEKADCPITYVSWLSAARYCNWKSHHCTFGLQSSVTTETGSYDLTDFDQGSDISTVTLTPGATFFLSPRYLIDTTFQDSTSQTCDPYLTSNRLGFCIGTLTTPSAGDSTGANAQGSSDQSKSDFTQGSNNPLENTPSSSMPTGRDVNVNVPSVPADSTVQEVGAVNSNQISINLVVVGAPNNPADVQLSGTNKTENDQNGYGSVLMPYQIGTYDVTAEQYCAFLNSVAKKNDPHFLYNTNMTSDPNVACIIRSGDTNSGYTYTPISGREKFPITYVYWANALRFCNWLENNQPIGDQTAATTEKGSYDIAAIHDFTPGPKTEYSIPSTPGAAWVLPTENQWYKAAYYIPLSNNNTPGKYCLFGTGNMDHPGNKWEEAVVANQANYCLDGTFTTSTQPHLTPVGSFKNSPSPWGAYDMAGEVSQWTSTFDLTGSTVIIRGGSWSSQTSDELTSKVRLGISGLTTSPTIGFRVVYNIPPPPVITHLDMKKDLVAIGAPDNDYDTKDDPEGPSLGKVSTVYQIQKYDVTAEQYCMFLNAVASHSDPHHLYHPQMTKDSNVACIIRYGNASRGYSYFPWPGREKFPVTYVNWFSALRFCNWLENDQPVGESSPETTESGSFTPNDQGQFSLATNNPKWRLPTEDQWYKAAYYSPAQNLYYSFGTASYSPPDNTISSKSINAANYCLNGIFSISEAPRLTPVGRFANTISPWGLYDMAGEVEQWTLTPVFSNPDQLIVRGGSWASTDFRKLRFSSSLFLDAHICTNTVGFRVIYNAPPKQQEQTMIQSFVNNAKFTGSTIWNDIVTTPNKFMTNTGGWFFNIMYYTIGFSAGEIAANFVNNIVISNLNKIFLTIATKIEAYCGIEVSNLFPEWMKFIYQFLLSPIKSRRLPGLQAADRLANIQQTWARIMSGLARGNVSLMFDQLVLTERVVLARLINIVVTALENPGVSTEIVGLSSASPSIVATDLALATADTAAAATGAAVGAETAAVAFFASPAAAVLIPLGLMIASYEILSYELKVPSPENDPRIGIGMFIDSIIRYAIPAIRLL